MITQLEPGWTDRYVGIPFKSKGRDCEGIDCWGVPYLVYAQELGIELPLLSEGYLNAADRIDLEQVSAGARRCFEEIELGSEQPLDVLLFRVPTPRQPGSPSGPAVHQRWHVGLVITPRHTMLHVEKGKDTVIERYRGATSRWTHRLVSAWRWTG